MYATKHERVLRDLNGNICKMDILHSIRRKEIDQTVLLDSTPLQITQTAHVSPLNPLKVIEVILILAVIFALGALVFNVFSSGTPSKLPHQKESQIQAYIAYLKTQRNASLLAFKEYSGDKWEQFISEFTQHVTCSYEEEFVCHLLK